MIVMGCFEAGYALSLLFLLSLFNESSIHKKIIIKKKKKDKDMVNTIIYIYSIVGDAFYSGSLFLYFYWLYHIFKLVHHIISIAPPFGKIIISASLLLTTHTSQLQLGLMKKERKVN